MFLYEGTINGQIFGYGSPYDPANYAIRILSIPAGEGIRTIIIETLKSAGITNYVVEDIEKEIPYELNFASGSTYADIWTKIRNLYDS